MKRAIVVACLAGLAACGGTGGDAYKGRYPTAEQVELKLPSGSRSQGLSSPGQKQQGLQGEQARFYEITRAVTAGVNGGVLKVLHLVKAISEHTPTQVTGTKAVWGPHTEPLSPNTWRFTVIEANPGRYSYQLEGKAKTANDGAYVTVLSGTHEPAVDAQGALREHFGAGDFVLDFDKAKTLPENDGQVGRVEVAYARADETSNATVDVLFFGVRDEQTAKLVDAAYKYVRKPGNGGEFEFGLAKDVDQNAAGVEDLTIKSRWLETGAGRSDVRAQGGNLAAPATASECWDENFQSRFLTASFDPSLGYGQESSACAFPTAEYSQL